jgi:Xaa-Pro aminopeptidase
MGEELHRRRAAGVPPGPPPAERARRLRTLREALRDRGLDGAVVYGSGPTHPDAVRYLSGYVHPFPRARSLLVVPASGPTVLVIDREWHREAARAMTWVDGVRAVPERDPDALSAAVEAALADCGLTDGRLGVVDGDLPAAVLEAVSTAGSGVDTAFVPELWWDLVAAPTDHDVRGIRSAAEAADAGLAALASACRPGRSEREVCFDVLAELAAAGAEFRHGAAVSTHVDVGAYARSESNLQPFVHTETPLDRGEMFWVDLIVCRDGYYVDCDRTVAIGEPSAAQRTIYEACEAMYEAMVEAVEPGVTGRAVWRAGHDVAAEYGYEDRLNGVYLGHTTGSTVSVPPFVAPDETRTLAAGQFLNVEPAIHVPGTGSACIENTLFVGSEGTTVLNDAPTDLIVA